MPRIKKPRAYPDKVLIKGALRRLMRRSPICFQVLNEAVHPTIKGERGGKQYVCAICKNTFQGKDVEVDHIQEVVRSGETIHDLDYNIIVERIFCSKDNLQVVCKVCHKLKTRRAKTRSTGQI